MRKSRTQKSLHKICPPPAVLGIPIAREGREKTMYAVIILSQYKGDSTLYWGNSGVLVQEDESKAVEEFANWRAQNPGVRAKLIAYSNEQGETAVIAEQAGIPVQKT